MLIQQRILRDKANFASQDAPNAERRRQQRASIDEATWNSQNSADEEKMIQIR